MSTPTPVCAVALLTEGSDTGGPTITQLAGGFVDGLEAVIGGTPEPEPTPPEPSTCANCKLHNCGRSHRGAIIGGAVGARVVVLGFVWLWLWLRNRRVGSEDGDPTVGMEPQMHELQYRVPEQQSREDGMQTSAQEMPLQLLELQSQEDGILTSTHELPGNLVFSDRSLRL